MYVTLQYDPNCKWESKVARNATSGQPVSLADALMKVAFQDVPPPPGRYLFHVEIKATELERHVTTVDPEPEMPEVVFEIPAVENVA